MSRDAWSFLLQVTDYFRLPRWCRGNLPDNAGGTGEVGSIPGQEDPLEKEMATLSNILAWKTPQTENPKGLSMGLQRVEHD